jgi:hypothetical protein
LDILKGVSIPPPVVIPDSPEAERSRSNSQNTDPLPRLMRHNSLSSQDLAKKAKQSMRIKRRDIKSLDKQTSLSLGVSIFYRTEVCLYHKPIGSQITLCLLQNCSIKRLKVICDPIGLRWQLNILFIYNFDHL